MGVRSASRASCDPSATTLGVRPGPQALGGAHEGDPRGSVQGPSVRVHHDPQGSIFVLCSQQQGLVARWRLRKPLVAAWMGVGWSPRPRLRARSCARLRGRWAVQPRAWGFRSPRSPSRAALVGSGVAAPQVIGPARRSRGSLAPGPPDPDTRPCLARAPLSGRKHQCVCPRPTHREDPPPQFWGVLWARRGGRTDSQGSGWVRSGAAGRGAGPEEAGEAGPKPGEGGCPLRTPPLRFGAHPGPRWLNGFLRTGQEGRHELL